MAQETAQAYQTCPTQQKGNGTPPPRGDRTAATLPDRPHGARWPAPRPAHHLVGSQSGGLRTDPRRGAQENSRQRCPCGEIHACTAPGESATPGSCTPDPRAAGRWQRLRRTGLDCAAEGSAWVPLRLTCSLVPNTWKSANRARGLGGLAVGFSRMRAHTSQSLPHCPPNKCRPTTWPCAGPNPGGALR